MEILSILGTIAQVIFKLKEVFDEINKEMEGEFDEKLAILQKLQEDLIQSTAQILEAIDGIHRQIDHDIAYNNIALADRALFNDLAVFQNKEAAMGNSFQAADRLLGENEVIFTNPFIYVVNMRLAIMKQFDPNYFENQQFRQEFQKYIDHLAEWIAQIKNLIEGGYYVTTELYREKYDPNAPKHRAKIHWYAHLFRRDVRIKSFEGKEYNSSNQARDLVKQQAEVAHLAAIKDEQKRSGIMDMEQIAKVWEEAFTHPLA